MLNILSYNLVYALIKNKFLVTNKILKLKYNIYFRILTSQNCTCDSLTCTCNVALSSLLHKVSLWIRFRSNWLGVNGWSYKIEASVYI